MVLSRIDRCSAATLKELWSPDAADGEYRDEMAVATYVVQVASHVARELQEELCRAEAIRSEIEHCVHWLAERIIIKKQNDYNYLSASLTRERMHVTPT